MHKPSRGLSSAFTLIELLVVIAIIAILAAILFPVFAQAKEAAKKTVDISNFKQVELGTLMYANDFDDVYPLIRWGRATWGCNNGPGGVAVECDEVHNAANSCDPYVKNRGVWSSPNDTLARNDLPPSGAVNNPGGNLSYTYNFQGQNRRNGLAESPYALGMVGNYRLITSTGGFSSHDTQSLTTTAVGNPADTVMMYPYYATFSYWHGQQAYSIDARRVAWPDPSVYGIKVWPNFNGPYYMGWANNDQIAIGAYSTQTNWGWADGHVRNFKRDQLMDHTYVTAGATALANHLRNKFAVDSAFH